MKEMYWALQVGLVASLLSPTLSAIEIESIKVYETGQPDRPVTAMITRINADGTAEYFSSTSTDGTVTFDPPRECVENQRFRARPTETSLYSQSDFRDCSIKIEFEVLAYGISTVEIVAPGDVTVLNNLFAWESYLLATQRFDELVVVSSNISEIYSRNEADAYAATALGSSYLYMGRFLGVDKPIRLDSAHGSFEPTFELAEAIREFQQLNNVHEGIENAGQLDYATIRKLSETPPWHFQYSLPGDADYSPEQWKQIQQGPPEPDPLNYFNDLQQNWSVSPGGARILVDLQELVESGQFGDAALVANEALARRNTLGFADKANSYRDWSYIVYDLTGQAIELENATRYDPVTGLWTMSDELTKRVMQIRNDLGLTPDPILDYTVLRQLATQDIGTYIVN